MKWRIWWQTTIYLNHENSFDVRKCLGEPSHTQMLIKGKVLHCVGWKLELNAYCFFLQHVLSIFRGKLSRGQGLSKCGDN